MNRDFGFVLFRNSVPLGGSKFIQAKGSLSQRSVAWQKHHSCHAADLSCNPCAFVLGQKVFPVFQADPTFFSQKLGLPDSGSYVFSGSGDLFRTQAGAGTPHALSGRLQNVPIVFV